VFHDGGRSIVEQLDLLQWGNSVRGLGRRHKGNSPSYSAGVEFELTGVAQSVELA